MKDGRYTQLRRIFAIGDILFATRIGRTVSEVCREVNERLLTRFDERTILRDLVFLEEMNYAERITLRRGQCWRWTADLRLIETRLHQLKQKQEMEAYVRTHGLPSR